MVPQFRHEANDGYGNSDLDREVNNRCFGQPSPASPTQFENFSRCEWMQSHETHDMKVKDEIERLLKE